MAFLFFEGLPGAGKSYEAVATQIVPFLQKGRQVVAYIEGLNVERIAQVAGLPVEKVREQLHILTRDDMRPGEVQKGGKSVPVDGAWLEKVCDNALHVFDEAQTWWPSRLRATEALTQFVTEHRHRGIDVLLMGQSLKDVSVLWRRRVDQKFTFLKLTALGSDKRYRVTIWKGQGNDEFVKVGDRLNKYDPKYFGTYSSHVSQDTNTATYTDKRANFVGRYLVWAVPLALGLLIWGGSKSWSFFHPEPPKVTAQNAAAGPVSAPVGVQPVSGRVTAAPDLRTPQERYFGWLDDHGRIRLSGMISDANGQRVSGVIEWVDGNTRVIERLTLDQLRDLGCAVLYMGGRVQGGVIRLNLGSWVAVATSWPIEAEGRVSGYRQDMIRPAADAGLPASQAAPVVVSSAIASPVVSEAPVQHVRPPTYMPPPAVPGKPLRH